jgi:hypothetical protein
MWTPASLPDITFWFDAGDFKCYKINNDLGAPIEIISKHDQLDSPSCYFRITDQGGRIGRIIWDNEAGAIGWERSWPKNQERIEFYFAQKYDIKLPPSHIGNRFSWPPKWPQG